MVARMSNRRFILFFLVGIAACAAGLWGLAVRARVVASDATRHVLCPVDPSTVDAVSVSMRGSTYLALERKSGAWRITVPFPSVADPAPVAQLLDMLTLSPIDDMRSESELLQLNETLADFGLNPPRATVILTAGGVTNVVHFGVETAAGNEIYARVEDVKNVFTLAADVFAAVPTDVDAFRPRALLACPRDEIAGFEFRVPDAAFVKLVREGTSWRMTAPLAAAADADVVSALADRLSAARVADFTLPSATQPPPPGTTPDGMLPAAALVPYGLSTDAALSVTVRGMDGSAETVLFGGAAGTNRVWALVRNGTTVVSVDAAVAEICRAHEAAFRDTRVFSFKKAETIKSISLTADSLVYVLGRDTNGLWRIDAPVVAPADQTTAAALAEKILTLKQNDLVPPNTTKKPGTEIRVSVETSAASYPAITVPSSSFNVVLSFADLRSKTLLTLDPSSVRRLSIKQTAAEAPTVVYDTARAVWNLETPVEGRRSNPAAIKSLLTALTHVEAVSVESVAATPADFKRCGLDVPACVIAIDVEATDVTRRNILIGGATSGGGRYATVGGVDAVFVISKQTAAALMTNLTE